MEVLRLLADPEAQLRYEPEVTLANVPAELACMWFDDLDAARPSEDLAPGEASRIMTFTSFYESRLRGLPVDRDVGSLHASTAWREIMAEAKATLDGLEDGSSNIQKQADDPWGRR